MTNRMKIILFSLAALIGSFVFVLPAKANYPPGALVVEWSVDGSSWLPLSGEPIFGETDFKPGDSVERLIKVVNNSGEEQIIGMQILDTLQPPCQENCLADRLKLAVTKEGETSPLTEDYLSNFYQQGEIKLSKLATGNQVIYHFVILFEVGDNDNNYQNSQAGFDIKIGFFGKESVGGEIPSSGGGGGGVFVSGLKIYNESASDINTNSVTITWLTNSGSTSRVIYSPEGSPHTLDMDSPPNYGYLFSTIEDSNKVTSHKVTIDGLSASTTYYFRCVSHGSPLSISREHSFTTLELGSSQEIQLEETSQEEEEGISYPKKVREIAGQRGGISGRILAGGESQIEGEVGVKEDGQGEEGKEKGDEEVEESELEETGKGNKFLALLASSITDFAKTNPWLLLLLLIILVLVFIFVFIFLRRRFKDRED